MKAFQVLGFCSLLAGITPNLLFAQPDPRKYFFDILQGRPHDTLSMSNGPYVSVWNGKESSGCEINFGTDKTLPLEENVSTFVALPGTEMYRLGWRMDNSILADGPGSGVFGIEKDAMRCIVGWAQPAYLAEAGEIVQGNKLSMTIQCGKK